MERDLQKHPEKKWRYLPDHIDWSTVGTRAHAYRVKAKLNTALCGTVILYGSMRGTWPACRRCLAVLVAGGLLTPKQAATLTHVAWP